MATGVTRAGRRRLPQGGGALMEAMVAILIFSFGVLGIILVAASIRATNDARYRAEAANLANAVIGDMWATAATDLDPQFGTGGPKLAAWQNVVARGVSLLTSGSGTIVPSVDIVGGIAGVALIQADAGASSATPPVLVQVTTMNGQVESIGVSLAGAVTSKHRVAWGFVSP